MDELFKVDMTGPKQWTATFSGPYAYWPKIVGCCKKCVREDAQKAVDRGSPTIPVCAKAKAATGRKTAQKGR